MSGLVSPEWAENHLEDPDVVFLEVSFYQPDRAAWFEGHIPGSHYVYWKDLCWDPLERQFPTGRDAADRLARYGVGNTTTTVLVGDPIQFGTYAYWVFTMAGLEDRLALLDGGHATWSTEGRPLTTEPSPTPVPASLEPGIIDEGSRIGRDEVRAGLGLGHRKLVDLRSAEEYRGDRVAPSTAPFDHGAERGGHIPGAVHLYYERLLRTDGRLRSPDEIEAEFRSEGIEDDADIVTYCRLSHRASLAWFALTRIAGRRRVRVYDGSWTEWGSMVGMPVERP